MSVTVLTGDNFNKEVQDINVPVLIDFWASWCVPCQRLSPVVDEVAEELGNTVKVCKVNVDEEMDLATKFEVESIPTLIVVKNGSIVNESVGVISKQAILDMLL